MREAEPLVEATRDGLRDRRHRGHVAVVDTRGDVIYSAGEPDHRTYMRSSTKPVQAMVAVESGAVETFGLNDREVAVMCASHSAQPEHVDAVRAILDRAGVEEDELRCGSHPPVHEASRIALYRRGEEPSAVHSNCSGKHAGMLAVCAHRGWPTDDYREPDHPLQQQLLNHMGEMSGLSPDEISVGTDGCGVPTYGMSVAEMAYMFARLGSPDDLTGPKAAAARRVIRAMRAHPLMVAGEGRVCTALNGLPGGYFAAKGGALGVYCVSLLREGLGLAVKIEDGNGGAAAAAALEAMVQLDIVSSEHRAALTEFWRPPVKNVPGDVVGQVHPTYRLRAG